MAIVEDHPLMSEALAGRLDQAGFDVAVRSAGVEDLPEGLDVDVVLCDLNLAEGGRQAGAAVGHLVRRGLRVLAMSGVARQAEVLDAVAAGAAGFVDKSAPAGQFVAATAAVAAGGHSLSPRLADFLLDDAGLRALRRDEIGAAERQLLEAVASGDTVEEWSQDEGIDPTEAAGIVAAVFDAARRRRRLQLPSAREREVLILIGCEGLSHKAAAARMGIRPSVVPDFLDAIKAKFVATHPDADRNMAPRAVCQRWAQELGLCQPGVTG